MGNSFLPAYLRVVANCIGNDFRDNFDPRRFVKPSQAPIVLKKKLARLVDPCLGRAGLVRVRAARGLMQDGVAYVEPHLENIQWLYEHLADEESKETLVQVLAYRALGFKKVKLPLNNANYWAAVDSAERQMQGAESIDLGFNGWRAYKTNLASVGYSITLFCSPTAVVTQFVLQQYRCQTIHEIIEAADGDTVIDAGGCYGDTALYFAHKVGPEGKVWSFEFLPENLKTFHHNIELNPTLEARVRLLENPLWSKTGLQLFIEGCGPGTRVLPSSSNPDARQVITLAIDDFVQRQNLPAVNLVKMDIEGAELQALQGAAQTIRRFRPKLAVCVYHSLEDFWRIPQYLDNLELKYRFYLRHFTIHNEETVLFAKSD